MADDPGREARRDVVKVATAIADALSQRAFTVETLALDRDVDPLVTRLRAGPPDVVFNLCESLGADSRGELVIPALLDPLGIPYTGSPTLALGLALHKEMAKEVLRARGVNTPPFQIVSAPGEALDPGLGFPVIVKPVREDASTGIHLDSVAFDAGSLERAVARVVSTLEQPAIVERYIEGREVYVPLLGNQPRRALPLTEIQFGRAFEGGPKILSYAAKWEPASDECRDSPAVACRLDPALEARVIDVARAAFEALGCRDYGRVDLRLDDEGVPHVIEVNPNCDLHPQAGFSRAALEAGLSYADLAVQLVELALARARSPARGPRVREPSVTPRVAARSGPRRHPHRLHTNIKR